MADLDRMRSPSSTLSSPPGLTSPALHPMNPVSVPDLDSTPNGRAGNNLPSANGAKPTSSRASSESDSSSSDELPPHNKITAGPIAATRRPKIPPPTVDESKGKAKRGGARNAVSVARVTTRGRGRAVRGRGRGGSASASARSRSEESSLDGGESSKAATPRKASALRQGPTSADEDDLDEASSTTTSIATAKGKEVPARRPSTKAKGWAFVEESDPSTDDDASQADASAADGSLGRTRRAARPSKLADGQESDEEDLTSEDEGPADQNKAQGSDGGDSQRASKPASSRSTRRPGSTETSGATVGPTTGGTAAPSEHSSTSSRGAGSRSMSPLKPDRRRKGNGGSRWPSGAPEGVSPESWPAGSNPTDKRRKGNGGGRWPSEGKSPGRGQEASVDGEEASAPEDGDEMDEGEEDGDRRRSGRKPVKREFLEVEMRAEPKAKSREKSAKVASKSPSINPLPLPTPSIFDGKPVSTGSVTNEPLDSLEPLTGPTAPSALLDIVPPHVILYEPSEGTPAPEETDDSAAPSPALSPMSSRTDGGPSGIELRVIKSKLRQERAAKIDAELLLWDELYNSIAASDAPVLVKQWGELESQLHVMRAQLENRQKAAEAEMRRVKKGDDAGVWNWWDDARTSLLAKQAAQVDRDIHRLGREHQRISISLLPAVDRVGHIPPHLGGGTRFAPNPRFAVHASAAEAKDQKRKLDALSDEAWVRGAHEIDIEGDLDQLGIGRVRRERERRAQADKEARERREEREMLRDRERQAERERDQRAREWEAQRQSEARERERIERERDWEVQKAKAAAERHALREREREREQRDAWRDAESQKARGQPQREGQHQGGQHHHQPPPQHGFDSTPRPIWGDARANPLPPPPAAGPSAPGGSYRSLPPPPGPPNAAYYPPPMHLQPGSGPLPPLPPPPTSSALGSRVSPEVSNRLPVGSGRPYRSNGAGYDSGAYQTAQPNLPPIPTASPYGGHPPPGSANPPAWAATPSHPPSASTPNSSAAYSNGKKPSPQAPNQRPVLPPFGTTPSSSASSSSSATKPAAPSTSSTPIDGGPPPNSGKAPRYYHTAEGSFVPSAADKQRPEPADLGGSGGKVPPPPPGARRSAGKPIPIPPTPEALPTRPGDLPSNTAGGHRKVTGPVVGTGLHPLTGQEHPLLGGARP